MRNLRGRDHFAMKLVVFICIEIEFSISKVTRSRKMYLYGTDELAAPSWWLLRWKWELILQYKSKRLDLWKISALIRVHKYEKSMSAVALRYSFRFLKVRRTKKIIAIMKMFSWHIRDNRFFGTNFVCVRVRMLFGTAYANPCNIYY